MRRFADLIPAGEVLDLACGGGRHARLLASLGHPVLALDRDADALARCAGPGISTMQYDVEQSCVLDWPFLAGRFAGIVSTNYLYRPLFKLLLHSLAPQGVLIIETFADGNARFGKPSNPDFLLQPGELIKVLYSQPEQKMHVLAYEDGFTDLPKPAIVQRICAIKNRLANLEPVFQRI